MVVDDDIALAADGADDDVAAALAQLAEHGWARLRRRAPASSLDELRGRADAIMAGATAREGLFFQHDSPSGAYADLRFGDGWVGPSPAYRKIEGLDRDPVFHRWIASDVVAAVARAAITGPVAVARAVLWTKAARHRDAGAGADTSPADAGANPVVSIDGAGGTELPWHQDGGKFWGLSGQPTLQLWTALDDAPLASGCVEVVPGTHHGGLATAEGGTVPHELTAPRAADIVTLPAVAGEILLLHNLVWHRSGRNRTPHARRALSVCLMSAAITCTRRKRAPRQFVRLW